MANKNEYVIDGKVFLKEIKNCYVWKKVNDEYTLYCDLHQRGGNFYDYWKNWGYLRKFKNKQFYLSEEAKKTVDTAINKFSTQIREARTKKYRDINLNNTISIFYKYDNDKFDFVVQFKTEAGNKVALAYENFTFEGMIDKIVWECSSDKIKDFDKYNIRHVNISNIDQNPFVISAKEYNDKELECKIKLYYKVATKEECEFLSKLYGKRILPNLPKEYDKDYVIDADTFDNYGLLNRSGYTILHRPYFAMMGSTHKKITLNPYTKYGVDAAKEDMVSIPFCEFLELFDREEKK